MRHIPQMVAAMTPFPYHIAADATLADAVAMMNEHNVRHLPVFADGDIIGILSERDIERAKIPGHPLRDETELRVGDLCTQRPYFVDVADPLDRVLDVLVEKRIGSALVLKEGELAGVFTAVDACALLAHMLREQFGPTPPGTEAA
ncbi:MAG: CBS domain-containing protein [Spongiibacteraceae bacterium]